MRVRVAVGVGAVLALVASVAGLIVTRDDDDRFHWVALGDSYSAGEGNRPFDDDRACNRSRAAAYPLLVTRALVDDGIDVELTFTACSKAVAGDLAGQAATVDDRTDLVTATIGGNDAGFGDLVLGCLATGTLRLLPGIEPCLADDAALPQRMASVRARVIDALEPIAARLRPDARFLLVGYPNPVPPDVACELFGADEATKATTIAEALDDTLAGVALELEQVEYVSMLEPFADHHVCADEAWIRGLEPYVSTREKPTLGGSFHPTVAGQQGYADVLYERIRAVALAD